MSMVSVSEPGDVIAVGIIAVVASQLRAGLQQHRLQAGSSWFQLLAARPCLLPSF
jgi:hypothetical protein